MTRLVPQTQITSASAAPENDRLHDVVVVGAGVVGVASAYALARRGLSVALVDRRSGPGCGASFANGAQLSYAYADALASPALLRKLPSLALGADPLFRIRPAFDPGMAAWGLKFLHACGSAEHRQATLATLALALESQQAMHDLQARHALAFAQAAPGKMHLYYDTSAFIEAGRAAALKRTLGVAQHLLTPAEAAAIEPALNGAKGLVGVIHSPDDEVGDPLRFCRELTLVLERQYDARLQFGFEASSVQRTAEGLTLRSAGGQDLRARTLLLASGAEGGALAARLGVHPPILPMKGYSFNAPPGPSAPRVSLTDTARKLVFCQLDGVMRIAGGAELGARDTRVDPAVRGRLIEAARAALPDAADYGQASEGWAGLRPMTPNSVPIIAHAGPRLVLNLGHGMLGWTLAMGSGERAATLVQECLR